VNDLASQARLFDLACERAVSGLSPEMQAELDALVATHGDPFGPNLEMTAAAVHLAALGPTIAMPRHVAERALAAATAPPKVVSLATRRRDPLRWAGWIAAAACLALAAGAWWQSRTAPRPDLARRLDVAVPTVTPPPPTAFEARERLLADAKDTVRVEWTPGKGATVSGDVVWSPSAQRGFMRFRGLAKNDRSAIQYQLWIFDAARDQRYPIDGGVFDVDAETGDVVVPIVAKLAVDKPKLFAVTIEKPGGVVVSDRKRIVATASVSG
jgi:hypothetical protein